MRIYPERNSDHNRALLFYLAALAVLLIAGLLRFINISNTPGWYSDEGTLVEIAANLLEGNIQYFALGKSTLIAARLPVFPTILAGIFHITGPSITALRYLTAGLGVLTVALVMVVSRSIFGNKNEALPLVAGLLLAIYPKAVLYSRLGFSYNLLAPVMVGLIWLMFHYLDTGRSIYLWGSGLLIGFGIATDIMILTVVPALLIFVVYQSWKDIFPFLFLVLIPIIGYSLFMLYIDRAAFVYDLNFILFRISAIPFFAQLSAIIKNYSTLVLQDFWWVAGIAGIFLIKNRKLKYLIGLLVMVPFVVLARTAKLFGLGSYYLIPFYPLLALAAGKFVTAGFPVAVQFLDAGAAKFFSRLFDGQENKIFHALSSIGKISVTILLLFIFILAPFVDIINSGLYQARTELITDISPVTVAVGDGEKVLKFINSAARETDLVLASPALAWGINAPVADFQMLLAYQGEETMHFPSDIPRDRFLYPVVLSNTAYVIIDPIWTNWAAVNIEGVDRLIDEIRDWPLVFSAGEIEIFENPSR